MQQWINFVLLVYMICISFHFCSFLKHWSMAGPNSDWNFEEIKSPTEITASIHCAIFEEQLRFPIICVHLHSNKHWIIYFASISISWSQCICDISKSMRFVGVLIMNLKSHYKWNNSTFFIVAGQCLNFNCAFALVLMLRQCITFLRTRGFGAFIPLDNHIYLHKLTGIVIAFFSLIHTIMHVMNFSIIVVNHPEINKQNFTLAEWMLTTRPGLYGLCNGCANPTGIGLATILLIMFVCSAPFVRRKGSFEVFYWTHLLYIPFWFLVLLHGPNFYKWFCVPLLIYLIERANKYDYKMYDMTILKDLL